MADEAGGPRGHLLSVPKANDTRALRADIEALKGAVGVVEDAYDAFQTDRAASGTANWQARRIGANPPEALATWPRRRVGRFTRPSGCRLHCSCRRPSQANRESWRQALFGVIAPLGRIVERELRDKIDPSVSLTFEELRASDLPGRARAFQAMVAGGIDVAKAAAQAGLMVPEETD